MLKIFEKLCFIVFIFLFFLQWFLTRPISRFRVDVGLRDTLHIGVSLLTGQPLKISDTVLKFGFTVRPTILNGLLPGNSSLQTTLARHVSD